MDNNKTSFRDPAGYIIEDNGIIKRMVKREYLDLYKKIFSEEWYINFENQNIIQKSFLQTATEKDEFFQINHEMFIFPIHVNEMTALQLYNSAILTLDIVKKALENNYILKDASAWNIISENGKLIFIDVTSFEKWNKNKFWNAYGQFIRHFIIPLILHRELKLNISEIFLTRREGIYPTEAFNLLGIKVFKKIMNLETVVLPYFFDKKNSIQKNIHNKKHKNINIKLNKAILNSTLDRLKKYIKKLKPTSYKSIWSSYEDEKFHYSEQDNLVKKNFVKVSLESINLNHNENYILDCGSNTGEFSKIASDLNYKVLAIDFDEQSLNNLLIKKYLNINTAKINIANPTPGIGWKNKEIRSFLERSEKKFLCTLFLGIIHHLTVTDRIPIDEILQLICSLSIKFSIIEFISNKDPKFIEIAKSNNHLYKYFDENYFENNTKTYFDIIDKKKINKTRSIYFLKKLES